MAEFKSKLFPSLLEATKDKITAMRRRLKNLEQILNKSWLYKGKYEDKDLRGSNLDAHQKELLTQEKYKLQKDLYNLEKEHGLIEEAQAWAYQFFPRSPKDFGLEVK